VLGLILWLVFNTPAIAVIASVTIDFIAGIPTIKHAWQKPQEETTNTFIMDSFAAFLTLLTIREISPTALVYPTYLFAINALTAIILIVRGKPKVMPERVN
jgi:hypothetical protein